MGRKSLRELEYTYLLSTYGVALDSARRSAMDGCLYETEIILARGRNCTAPTVLTGAFFLTKGKTHELVMETDGTISWRREKVALKTVLSLMQIGAIAQDHSGGQQFLSSNLWKRSCGINIAPMSSERFPALSSPKANTVLFPLNAGTIKLLVTALSLQGAATEELDLEKIWIMPSLLLMPDGLPTRKSGPVLLLFVVPALHRNNEQRNLRTTSMAFRAEMGGMPPRSSEHLRGAGQGASPLRA